MVRLDAYRFCTIFTIPQVQGRVIEGISDEKAEELLKNPSTSVEPLQSFVGEDGTVTEPVIDHLTEQERIDLGIDDQAEEETQDQEQEQLTRVATPTGHMTSQSQTNTTTHKSNNASINMSGGQITINIAPPS